MKAYDDIRDPRLQEWFDDYINVAPPERVCFRPKGTAKVSYLKKKGIRISLLEFSRMEGF